MIRHSSLTSLGILPCITLFLLLVSGCDRWIVTTDQPNTTVQTGTPRQLVQQSVGVAGGSVVVNLPGDSLDGLSVTVPSGALTSTQTITVTATSLKTNPFGANFHPLSPLIRIAGISGYAQDIIQVSIPIHKKSGDFAMAFLYNETTKKLEGLPLIALSDTSVTAGTRILSAEGGLAKKTSGASTQSLVDLVVSSFTESALAGSGIISTSFHPGVDDWEFVNYGSYLSPDGNCAGQTITSMWYWYEVKLAGGIPLYHGYDRVKSNDAFWQDNPSGYRFASVIQADLNWDGLQRTLWKNVRDYLPPLSYRAFAAAMLVTGEPQYAGVYSPKDLGGHALVAYKMDYANGKIWVADPNFPGNTNRYFTFSDSIFQPYFSALNAADPGINFTQIGYFAKTAYIDWDKITARYGEFTDKTIGGNAPHAFPHAVVWRLDSDSGALADSAIVGSDTLPVQNRCADCGAYLNAGGATHAQFMTVFDSEGTAVDSVGPPVKSRAAVVLNLVPGLNTVGFYLTGDQQTGTDSVGNGVFSHDYVNFVWRDIFYKKMDIEPQDTNTQTNAPLTLTAHCYGVFPKTWHMEWSIQDTGGIRDTILFSPDSSVKKTWPVAGRYTVLCKLMDDVSGKLFTADSTVVQVGGSTLLARLKQCIRITVLLRGFDSASQSALTLNDGTPLPVISFSNWNGEQGVVGTITWDSTKFSLPYQLSATTGSAVSATTGTITGRISASGTSVDTMTLTSHTVLTDSTYAYNLVETTDQSISLRHFPLLDLYTTQIDIGDEADSTDARPLVTNVTWRMVSTLSGASNTDQTLATINWADPNLYLTVDFTDR